MATKREMLKLLEYPMVKKTIEQGEDEIDIEVSFDYEPEEESGVYSAGQSENVDIYQVLIADTDVEICLLPEVRELMEEEILCDAHENRKYYDHDPYNWIR